MPGAQRWISPWRSGDPPDVAETRTVRRSIRYASRNGHTRRPGAMRRQAGDRSRAHATGRHRRTILSEPMTTGPLSRFTVLDLTRVRAGPTAVRYLADWGANCIKVEMPPGAGDMDMGGPRHGPDFQNLHRNKKSITLNLKEPDGLAVFKKLVEKADVVVENYRADVK